MNDVTLAFSAPLCVNLVAGGMPRRTATSITVTSPVVANVTPGLGSTNYSGVCAVTVVQVGTPSLTSPVNANTHFVYLAS